MMHALIDWLVNRTILLDRWRGTESWIGRLVRASDVRHIRRLQDALRERDDDDARPAS